MKLNSDFSQRVVVNPASLEWVDSPVPGIQRQLIERDGGEVARATLIVRYAAGSVFKNHRHDLGKKIVVLDGVFSDESGSFGPGTYIKNPPGSSHAPSSATGCTLLVKLRHLDPADSQRIVVDTRQAARPPGLQGLCRVFRCCPFLSSAANTPLWRAGRRGRGSMPIDMTAVRRFMCWKASLRMSSAATLPGPGYAVRI